MKIGVISDTHIPDRCLKLPDKIIQEFRNVDMVIHAGDLVDFKVLDELKAVCKDVRAVQGNMDPPEVKSKLPEKEVIKVGKYKIGVFHGLGRPDKLIEQAEELFKNDNVNVVIFGHSHNATSVKKNGILYFNPGSATDKITSFYNSYGIIEINDKIETRIFRL